MLKLDLMFCLQVRKEGNEEGREEGRNGGRERIYSNQYLLRTLCVLARNYAVSCIFAHSILITQQGGDN
jgi:hypothetical protein